MDRLTALEAFIRVAEAGSFSEAARRWGRSKAVLSKYVAQLEDHLGVRLFQRTTRALTLTEAGRAHLERGRTVLALADESEALLRAEASALSGPLRVTAPPGILSLHRRAVVVDFLRKYPQITLELELTHRMIDLVEERIDVAIRLTEPDDSTLVARRLAPAPLVLVAAPAFLAASGRPTEPAALAEFPCLLDTNFRFGARWPFRVNGHRYSVEVRGPVRVNSPVLVRELALDGLGVALVPAMLVEADLAEGSLIELFPGTVDVVWSVYAVTSQRRFLPARARAFIEHLRLGFGAMPVDEPSVDQAP